MDNTKIDWCDMSWNPVTGCRHGCPYCYARGIAKRFSNRKNHHLCTGDGAISPITFGRYLENGLHELDGFLWWQKDGEHNEKDEIAVYPFGFEPTLHRYRLEEPAHKQRPRNIFVGSMADVFGSWVPAKWIADVLDACEKAPQHNYLFLTKNPERYTELDHLASLPRKSNFWYGSTVTAPEQSYFYSNMHKTFLSIEPLLVELPDNAAALNGVDWVIIGAMTGPGSEKHRPERTWVEDIVAQCRVRNIPVFMKGSLAGIWGKALIQEYPPELKLEVKSYE